MAPAAISVPPSIAARPSASLRVPRSPRPMASFASRLSRAVATGVRAMSTASSGGVPVEVSRGDAPAAGPQGSARRGLVASPLGAATVDRADPKPIPSRIGAAAPPATRTTAAAACGSRLPHPLLLSPTCRGTATPPPALRYTTPTARCAWWSLRRCPAIAGSRCGAGWSAVELRHFGQAGPAAGQSDWIGSSF